MRYLNSTRGRLILASFLVTSVLLVAFPMIDIQVSALFFDGRFRFRELWWQPMLSDGTTYLLCLIMVAIVGIYAFNRLSKRKMWRLDGKRVLYLFLVLFVGAGLIVNLALKDNFGRARPRDIAEFGGSKIFTPAFVVSRQCHTNCSFSSGEGAAGFFSLALAFAMGKKRRILAAAIAIGVLISLARIASGAHFFSDTVVSFFVMLIVADILFYYVVLPKALREACPARASARAGIRARLTPVSGS